MQILIRDPAFDVTFQCVCVQGIKRSKYLISSSLRASTEPGSFDGLLFSSAMANMRTSSPQLDFNLSKPFPLSPTNLNFSPGRLKTLRPASWGNIWNRKRMSVYLALCVLCESIGWIMVIQLVSNFTYHKLDEYLLLGNASVFHHKQSVERGLKITFHSQLSIGGPLMQHIITKLCQDC